MNLQTKSLQWIMFCDVTELLPVSFVKLPYTSIHTVYNSWTVDAKARKPGYRPKVVTTDVGALNVYTIWALLFRTLEAKQ